MIKGIGIDLIELGRIRLQMEKGDRLAKRILTESELAMYNSIQNPRRKLEFLAGRFAAKEAFAKAVGSGIGKLGFKHIELQTNEQGAPTLTAKGYELNRIFVSISHSEDYAVAQVVLGEAESES